MSRLRLSPGFLLCFALLAGTAFAQTTFDRKTYAHTGLVRGDFNLDGNPDLLGSDNGNYRVLLNNGDGTFRGPVSDPQPVGSVKPGDFNRDGRTDLVGCYTPNPETSPQAEELGIWLGAGEAKFNQPRGFPVPGDCHDVAVEDFNDDGNQDTVVIWVVGDFGNALNNGVTVFFGDGAGGVSSSATTEHVAAINSDDLECKFSNGVAGNYDRAGGADVVITATCANDTFDQSVVLFGKGTGTGQFTFTKTDDVNDSLRPMKDDVNQDSRLDVVVRASLSGPHAAFGSSLEFWRNTNASGTPRWEKKVVYGTGGDGDCIGRVNSGIAVDINGDTIKDAVFTEMFRPGDCIDFTEHYFLGIALGRADGGYSEPQKITLTAEPIGVVSADFDRDGRPDLAVAVGGSTEIFLNRNNAPTCMASPALRSVQICGSASASGSTLTVRANTTSGSPVTGMKVYIDDAEVFFTPNDTINKKLTVSAGEHRVTVRAWDGQGAFSAEWTTAAAPAPGSGFALAASPASNIVKAGQSAAYTVTVAPQSGGFPNAVTLACSAGLPAGAACSFNPAAVTPGENAASSTLTITTTSPTVAALRPPDLDMWAVVAMPGVLGLVALPGMWRRRRWTILTLIALAVLTLTVLGCGGGASSEPTSKPTPVPTGGTPSGSYVVTVTGTSGTTQQSATVTLNVQ